MNERPRTHPENRNKKRHPTTQPTTYTGAEPPQPDRRRTRSFCGTVLPFLAQRASVEWKTRYRMRCLPQDKVPPTGWTCAVVTVSASFPRYRFRIEQQPKADEKPKKRTKTTKNMPRKDRGSATARTRTKDTPQHFPTLIFVRYRQCLKPTFSQRNF